MKRSFTKIAAVMLSVAFILALFPGMKIRAANVLYSGICGDPDVNEGKNVTWAIDDEGVLTISGNGDMNNKWYFWTPAPWRTYSNKFNTVIIEDGVTSIGTCAFCGYNASYSNLSVVVPGSVKKINEYAFEENSGLISITLSEGIEEIGLSAFSRCTNLESITIPDSVTKIAGSPFSYCYALKNVKLSENLEKLSYDMFYSCSSLESITIPDSVITADSGVFSHSGLKSITLPDGLTTISGDMFWYCSELTEVTIPNSVTIIDDYAFQDCTSLTSITIPGSVEKIEYNAFKNCYALTDVTISDGVKYIESGAFYDSGVTKITIPGSVEYVGEAAFRWCEDLTDVTLEDGVKEIGYCTFDGCTSLVNVTLPDTLETIDKKAFENCPAIKSITLPGSLVYLGDNIFRDCTGLESVTIDEGVKDINIGLFFGCTSLKEVNLPESLEKIQAMAFYDCTSLESIVIPVGVTYINTDAFSQCTNLTKVTIDKSLASTCESSGVFSSTGVSDLDYVQYDIINTSSGGTVTTDATSASTDKVTFTVTPEENFAVGSVTLTDNGVATVLTPDDNGQYSFVMPSNAVSVEAVYTRVKADISFCSDDGTVLQATKYDVNAIPSYTGETPTKAETYEYSYEFAGWTDGYKTYGVGEELPAATDDVSYRAVFTEIKKPGEYYVNYIELKDGTVVFSIKQVQNDDQTFDLVDKIISDGNELTSGSQYDLTKGSAVITLKKDYFDSLSLGKHTLEVKFKDGGSITIEYSINGGKNSAKSITTASGIVSVPASGEGISMTAVAGTAMILAACAVTGIILTKKRREE